jgi:hypothetical protein
MKATQTASAGQVLIRGNINGYAQLLVELPLPMADLPKAGDE